MRLDKVACLFPVTFLFAIAGGITSLGMIFFAKNVLGATPGRVGVLCSSWSVFYVLGCFFSRRWAPSLPPRFSIVAASFTAFFSVGMIFMLKSLAWAFFFYALYGLALAMFWPVVMGWISAGLEDRQLSRVMGWFNFSWSMGSIVSPVVAGWLEDHGDAFAVRAGSAIFLATALFMTAAILLVPALAGGAAAARAAGQPAARGASRGTPLRYPAWMGIFGAFFLLGVITTVMSLAAGEDLAVSKKTVGIFLFARSLVMTLGLVAMGQTSWWHFRGGQIAAGIPVGILAAVLLVFARAPAMIFFIMLVVGVYAAHGYTNSLFHGVSGVADKTWRMAVHEMVLNAGAICGSAAGGFAYGAGGIVFAYSLSAGVLALVGLASLLVMARAARAAKGGAAA